MSGMSDLQLTFYQTFDYYMPVMKEEQTSQEPNHQDDPSPKKKRKTVFGTVQHGKGRNPLLLNANKHAYLVVGIERTATDLPRTSPDITLLVFDPSRPFRKYKDDGSVSKELEAKETVNDLSPRVCSHFRFDLKTTEGPFQILTVPEYNDPLSKEEIKNRANIGYMPAGVSLMQ